MRFTQFGPRWRRQNLDRHPIPFTVICATGDTTATSNDWTRNSMAPNQASPSSYDLVADLLNINNTLNIITIVGAFVFGFLAVYGCYLTVRHQRWERLHHRSLRHLGLSHIPDYVSWEQKTYHPASHQLGRCVAQGAPTVKQAINMQVRS